jgi:hypothetical protein
VVIWRSRLYALGASSLIEGISESSLARSIDVSKPRKSSSQLNVCQAMVKVRCLRERSGKRLLPAVIDVTVTRFGVTDVGEAFVEITCLHEVGGDQEGSAFTDIAIKTALPHSRNPLGDRLRIVKMMQYPHHSVLVDVAPE